MAFIASSFQPFVITINNPHILCKFTLTTKKLNHLDHNNNLYRKDNFEPESKIKVS